MKKKKYIYINRTNIKTHTTYNKYIIYMYLYIKDNIYINIYEHKKGMIYIYIYLIYLF